MKRPVTHRAAASRPRLAPARAWRAWIAAWAAIIVAMTAAGAAASDPPVSRDDLARALIDVERAVREHPARGAERTRRHRAFDIAAGAFFSRQYSDAVRQMRALTRSIRQPDASAIERRLDSLTVDFSPPMFVIGAGDAHGDDSLLLRVRSLYSLREGDRDATDIAVRLVDADGHVRWRGELHLAADEATITHVFTIGLDELTLEPGIYRAELEATPKHGTDGAEDDDVRGAFVKRGRLVVAPMGWDARRAEMAERLAGLARDQDEDELLADARRSTRNRLQLLNPRGGNQTSIRSLIDPLALADDLEGEIAALEEGRHPYEEVRGDHWRTIGLGATDWPLRAYIPAHAAGSEPLPLVVALHGAGGDENMFLDGYGAGVLKDLADEHGLIIASPLTYPLTGNVGAFDTLLKTVEAWHKIDPARVYLIGHSLGAGAVATILHHRSDRVAAAVCIAGAGRFVNRAEAAYPPVLVYGARHDFIVPPGQVASQAESGRQRGLPIEYRLEEDMGHVLIVGEVLPDAIAWLINHARADDTP